MKPLYLILAVMLAFTACNEINDLRPVEPGLTPDAAVQVVKSKFPDATDLTLKTMVSQTVWEARFRVNADQYTSLVSNTEMFETFRAAPDSSAKILPPLMEQTSFAGGSLSGNTEDIAYDKESRKRHKMQFSYRGSLYNFDALYYRGTVPTPASAVFENMRYKIVLTEAKALPKEVQDYLDAHPDLTFLSFEAWIGLNDEKLFNIRVQFKTAWGKDELGDVLLTEKGELKWMSRAFNAPQAYTPESNFEEMPAAIQQVLDQSPELASFQFRTPAQDRWRCEYDGVTAYYLNLINKNGAEVCMLYFDGSGALLYKRYFVSL